MLHKLFNRALTLIIDGEELSFESINEFEFALGGRTNVPASKLGDLLALSPEELKREAKSIKAIEKRFVDILSRSIEQPGEVGRLVRGVDIQVFSNDYEWRPIFKALNQQGAEYDELRRIAVVKYLQYLRSRQDVIKQTYRLKVHEISAPAAAATPAAPPPAASAPDAANRLEETKDILKETSIFEALLPEPELEDKTAPFTRLPKGEAVYLHPDANSEFEVRLSKHPFAIRNTAPPQWVDAQGGTHQLSEGKNVIGRDGVCNVVVETGLRDVSRLHLIIEPLPDGLRFTDLSSHGTFVPTQLLPSLEA